MKDEHATLLRLRDPAAAEPVDLPSAEQVIAFLGRNPDFLLRNDEILCELELPHRAGAAVSLVERQVTLLRERNIDSRQRLNRLLETARDNDLLFGHTRGLILALLEAHTLAAVDQVLLHTLRREFAVEQGRLLLLDVDALRWPDDAARLAPEHATGALKGLLRAGRPVVGALRPQEREALFGTDAVQSAAVVPVGGETPIALLVAGSSDPRRFHGEMGTLFLEFIGEVLARLLPRFARRS